MCVGNIFDTPAPPAPIIPPAPPPAAPSQSQARNTQQSAAPAAERQRQVQTTPQLRVDLVNPFAANNRANPFNF